MTFGTTPGTWTTTLKAGVFWWGAALVTVVCGGAAILLRVAPRPGQDSTVGTIIVLVVGALALITMVGFTRVRVTVDARGMRVDLPLLGLRIKNLPLDRIETVSADPLLSPTQWGGWGYRVLPGRSAIILRRGPALVIGTTADKYFAVSLEDPETPAALLTSLKNGPLSSDGSAPGS